jgi:hypothetical protein
VTYRSATAGLATDPRPTASEAEAVEVVRGTPAAPALALPASVERGFTFALLLSALRCTVQYVVFPFVLPWLGLTGTVPPWMTLILSGLALFALVRNVRYLWRIRHARRWSYIVLALVVMGALLLFVGMDLRALLA